MWRGLSVLLTALVVPLLQPDDRCGPVHVLVEFRERRVLRRGHAYLLDSCNGSGLVSDTHASADTATVSSR